jgi:hypothetical protein
MTMFGMEVSTTGNYRLEHLASLNHNDQGDDVITQFG